MPRSRIRRSHYYNPVAEEDESLVQYKRPGEEWTTLPLESNASDWSLMPAKHGRGVALFVTPCPDTEPVSAAIRVVTNGAALDENTGLFNGQARLAGFVTSLRTEILKKRPTEPGPGGYTPQRLVPDWIGGQEITVRIGTMWTPAYLASLNVMFDHDILTNDGELLPAGTTERWHDFPSAQGECKLTNRQTARGSWIDYDWDYNETSALQAALSRLVCIPNSDEELENHMTRVTEWDPEIPTVGEDPVSEEFSLLCHNLGLFSPVTATIALEVVQARRTQWEALPLTTNYRRSQQQRLP